jgi:membrane-associated phospholipid phosphatase
VRHWELASLLFFGYKTAVALVRQRAGRRAVLRALGGCAAGLLLTLTAIRLPYLPLAHEWLLPPSLLLIGYWTSGLLFIAPIAWQERALLAGDRRLHVMDLARRVPGWLASALEIAYVGVYPLIPLALIIHVLAAPSPDPARFWTVILVTDYVCFAFLPWVQTRPPRSLEDTEPWQVPLRRLNVGLLGATSIQVNTFPSGHAAEGLAAALLVLDTSWPAVLAMFSAALGVSAGAVLGRYHYAADAITGWIVAAIVWWALR